MLGFGRDLRPAKRVRLGDDNPSDSMDDDSGGDYSLPDDDFKVFGDVDGDDDAFHDLMRNFGGEIPMDADDSDNDTHGREHRERDRDDCRQRENELLDEATRIDLEMLRLEIDQIIQKKGEEGQMTPFLNLVLGFMSVNSRIRSTNGYDISSVELARDRALESLRKVRNLERRVDELVRDSQELEDLMEADDAAADANREQAQRLLRNTKAVYERLPATRAAAEIMRDLDTLGKLYKATVDLYTPAPSIGSDVSIPDATTSSALKPGSWFSANELVQAMTHGQFGKDESNAHIYNAAERYLESRGRLKAINAHIQRAKESYQRPFIVYTATLDILLVDCLSVGPYPATEHIEDISAKEPSSFVDVARFAEYVEFIIRYTVERVRPKTGDTRSFSDLLKQVRSGTWLAIARGFPNWKSYIGRPGEPYHLLKAFGLFDEQRYRLLSFMTTAPQRPTQEPKLPPIGEQDETEEETSIASGNYLRHAMRFGQYAGTRNDDFRLLSWLVEHAIKSGGAHGLVLALSAGLRHAFPQAGQEQLEGTILFNIRKLNTDALPLFTESNNPVDNLYERTMQFLVQPATTFLFREWSDPGPSGPHPVAIFNDLHDVYAKRVQSWIEELASALDENDNSLSAPRAAFLVNKMKPQKRGDEDLAIDMSMEEARDFFDAKFRELVPDGTVPLSSLDEIGDELHPIAIHLSHGNASDDNTSFLKRTLFPLAYATHLSGAFKDLIELRQDRLDSIGRPSARPAKSHVPRSAVPTLKKHVETQKRALESRMRELRDLLESNLPIERTINAAIESAFSLLTLRLPKMRKLTSPKELIFARPDDVSRNFAGLVAFRHRQTASLQGAAGEYQHVADYPRIGMREYDFVSRLALYEPLGYVYGRQGRSAGRIFRLTDRR